MKLFNRVELQNWPMELVDGELMVLFGREELQNWPIELFDGELMDLFGREELHNWGSVFRDEDRARNAFKSGAALIHQSLFAS